MLYDGVKEIHDVLFYSIPKRKNYICIKVQVWMGTVNANDRQKCWIENFNGLLASEWHPTNKML